jgi:hypothetical protein
VIGYTLRTLFPNFKRVYFQEGGYIRTEAQGRTRDQKINDLLRLIKADSEIEKGLVVKICDYLKNRLPMDVKVIVGAL